MSTKKTNNVVATMMASLMDSTGWLDDADSLIHDLICEDDADERVADFKIVCRFIEKHGNEEDALPFGCLADDLDEMVAEARARRN